MEIIRDKYFKITELKNNDAFKIRLECSIKLDDLMFNVAYVMNKAIKNLELHDLYADKLMTKLLMVKRVIDLLMAKRAMDLGFAEPKDFMQLITSLYITSDKKPTTDKIMRILERIEKQLEDLIS